MASYFSEHFASITAPTVLIKQQKVPVGVHHARMRYSCERVLLTAVLAVGEQIRMGQFKSGDRFHDILLTCDNAGSTGDINIGLAKTGAAHAGAFIDEDLFATALDVNAGALARVDQFDEAGLNDYDRNKPLWELAGQSEDPFEDWDLVITGDEIFTNAACEMQLEVHYTSDG